MPLRPGYHEGLTFAQLLVVPILILYCVVLILVLTGFIQILKYFNRDSQRELENAINNSALEGVTILRPIKGIDPQMEWCLESSFKQDYLKSKIEIVFCVQSSTDPGIPIIRKLISKYPETDAKLLVDKDQDHLDNFGPNPKVNNLHKGYKAAKYDIIWVLDSNVYTYPQTLKRSVYTLQNNLNNGSGIPTLLGSKKKVKLVTHVPIVISTSKHMTNWGSKLDEMFMSTSHGKFYVALNRVQPAPCVNGKSNLYRRSDLDSAVSRITNTHVEEGDGFKHFAKYIGEDNMIAIALWDGVDGCAGMSRDIVLQPIGGQNSVRDYIARRVRWLRVRKYMVLAATLIEPATESLVSGVLGSFSINVLLHHRYAILWRWFVVHMALWAFVDYIQFRALYRLSNEVLDGERRFHLLRYFTFWTLREVLALPIWVQAICGSRIDWRGQRFKILPDLSAEPM